MEKRLITELVHLKLDKVNPDTFLKPVGVNYI